MNSAIRPASSKYREIYRRILEAIEGGVLRPGDPLPSARALATDFNTARGTVEMALELLTGEGLVVARGRKGRVVSALPTASIGNGARQVRGPEVVREPHAYLYEDPAPLIPGLPAFDLFPRKPWSQLVGRHARRSLASDLSYVDPLGLPLLRSAIAGYLGVAHRPTPSICGASPDRPASSRQGRDASPERPPRDPPRNASRTLKSGGEIAARERQAPTTAASRRGSA